MPRQQGADASNNKRLATLASNPTSTNEPDVPIERADNEDRLELLEAADGGAKRSEEDITRKQN
jgi:hypothetical protein